jgi:hypothetical protein
LLHNAEAVEAREKAEARAGELEAALRDLAVAVRVAGDTGGVLKRVDALLEPPKKPGRRKGSRRAGAGGRHPNHTV